MSSILAIFIAVFGLGLSSCGRDTHSELASQPIQELPELIVAASGWNSCEEEDRSPRHTGVYQGVESILANWPSADRPEVISSCFNFRSHLRFVSTSHPEIQETADPYVFAEYVLDQARIHGRRVALLGHSHGGWLVMSLARLHGEELEIKSLHTMDAISFRNCGKRNFLYSESCHQAPDDFSTEDLNVIRRSVDYWRHDYQQRSHFLRSTPIANADVNWEHAMTEFARVGFAAHQNMDNLSHIWQDVAVTLVPGMNYDLVKKN